jgi:hypothetical protein
MTAVWNTPEDEVWNDAQSQENDELGKYLRVVVLEDGETIHNAFPDRRFKGEKNS